MWHATPAIDWSGDNPINYMILPFPPLLPNERPRGSGVVRALKCQVLCLDRPPIVALRPTEDIAGMYAVEPLGTGATVV